MDSPVRSAEVEASEGTPPTGSPAGPEGTDVPEGLLELQAEPAGTDVAPSGPAEEAADGDIAPSGPGDEAADSDIAPSGPADEATDADIAPSGRADEATDADVAPSGDANPPAPAEDREELVRTLQARLGHLVDLQERSGRLDFDAEALSLDLVARDPTYRRLARLFAHVSDTMSFDPYPGRVRGARGALFSRAGNSVDTALMVADILAAQQIPWRLARVTLDDQQAAELISSAVPSSGISGSDDLAPATDPGSFRWRRRTVAEHWWVEAEIDGAWVAFDAVYPGLELARAVAEPAERYSVGEIPHALEHSVTIRLMHRRERRPAVMSLTYAADMVDLSYRNVVLVFNRQSAQFTRPVLRFADAVIEGEPIDLREADSLWIELEFGTGRTAYTVRRELRDVRETVDLMSGDLQVFSMLFLPGWVGPDYYNAVAQGLIRELVEASALLVEQATLDDRGEPIRSLSPALAARLEPILSTAAGLVGLTFARRSDGHALALAHQLGVRPYYARPRILIAAAIQSSDGLAFQLDLRDDSVQAIPHGGLPVGISTAFQAVRGRIDSQLASEVLAGLTGLPTIDPMGVIQGARELDVAFLSLSPSDQVSIRRIGASDLVRQRIEQDAAGGPGVVITPRESILVNGIERTAWWLAQSSDGSLVGSLDSGIRGAISGFLVRPANPETSSSRPLLLARHTLDVVEALVSGALDQATGPTGLEQDPCYLLCDLEQIGESACGNPRRDSLSRCLSGRVASEDPLGLGLNCQDMMQSFRCGRSIARAVFSGTLTLQAPEEGAFRGPWSTPLPSLEMMDCVCE